MWLSNAWACVILLVERECFTLRCLSVCCFLNNLCKWCTIYKATRNIDFEDTGPASCSEPASRRNLCFTGITDTLPVSTEWQQKKKKKPFIPNQIIRAWILPLINSTVYPGHITSESMNVFSFLFFGGIILHSAKFTIYWFSPSSVYGHTWQWHTTSE